MQIDILGAESLGVRSLCCVVTMKDRKVVIDPGVALGFRRHGLLPHPVQVAASERIRSVIVKALEDATDIVISHYHGDHIPLVDANPYQLSVERVAKLCLRARFWTKSTDGLSYKQIRRAGALADGLGRILPVAEGMSGGPLSFSFPVSHGERGRHGGTVMMTRVEEGGEVFVHASDIQMLDDAAVEQICDWHPNIVLASGPPIYLPGFTLQKQEDALRRTLRLAGRVDVLILDHHLMRSREGEQWLDNVSSLTAHNILCAADFMGLHRNLLEADRVLWYKKLPVSEGWHEAYARGEIDAISEWSDLTDQFSVR
ncbi:MAG: MBL fold metallo-hydrolase [Dehalococcoidia bacterium]|nr:MBL fold metallo-hydrolase [Dehalococcoidia bacterium]